MYSTIPGAANNQMQSYYRYLDNLTSNIYMSFCCSSKEFDKFQIKYLIHEGLDLRSSKSGPETLLKIDPQKLLRIDPQTLLKIAPQLLLKIDPQMLLNIDPQTLLKIHPQLLLKIDPQTLLKTGPQVLFIIALI